MNLKKKLPNKLSDLIDLAVIDAIACGKDKRYELNMDRIHSADQDDLKKCEVCMAGAIIAQTLGADSDLNLDFNEGTYHKDTPAKLSAIDSVRTGDLTDAFDNLDTIGTSVRLSDQVAIKMGKIIQKSLSVNGRAPWRVYRRCASKLRALGL